MVIKLAIAGLAMPDFTNSFSHTFQFPASVPYISVLVPQPASIQMLFPWTSPFSVFSRTAFLNFPVRPEPYKISLILRIPSSKTISPRGSRNQSMRYHLRPQYLQTLTLLNSSSEN